MHLTNPQAFFAKVREGLLGPTLSDGEVIGCDALLTAMDAWGLAWTAYGLATSYHETWHSMQPAKEVGSDDYFRRMYDIQGARPQIAAELGNVNPGDGARFAGRGYVELTGRKNYERADLALGLDGALVANPDLALQADHAAAIMVRGMSEGWFTGRRLSSFLPAQGPALRGSYTEARRVINGTDKADLIADYALQFQEALQAAA